MQHPADTLRQMVSGLSEKPQRCFVMWGCPALGLVPNMDAPKPWFTVDDLDRRVRYLIDELNLMEKYVVPSVIHFMVDLLEGFVDPERADHTLDFNLQEHQALNSLLETPLDDRPFHFPDDSIKKMMGFFENNMMGREARTREAEEMLDEIVRARDEHFPSAYWEQWNKFCLRGGNRQTEA